MGVDIPHQKYAKLEACGKATRSVGREGNLSDKHVYVGLLFSGEFFLIFWGNFFFREFSSFFGVFFLFFGDFYFLGSIFFQEFSSLF